MENNMIKLLRNTIFAVASAMSFAANASIIHEGGEFDLTASWIDSDSISVTYTADFTNWTGTTDYIYSVDWKLEGYKSMLLIVFQPMRTALGFLTSGLRVPMDVIIF